MSECKKCGAREADHKEQIFKNGTKHLAIICRSCGSHNGFAPSINPKEFKMPFGKYKGKLLLEIIKADMDYTHWLAGTSKNMSQKIETLIDWLAAQKDLNEAIK